LARGILPWRGQFRAVARFRQEEPGRAGGRALDRLAT
jgi:hypothetical protein